MKNRLLLVVILLLGMTPSFAQKKVSDTTKNRRSDTILLKEVIVQRPPVVIKKDTVEFSADAFKTKPNAIAEDLLKKLPGVEVDKSGNIKAQGENIKKVYVNGKEFFGNDPKMATKNITADMIDAVQVYDDMSEQAKFTKIDDGSKAKVLNIKLKKSLKQGNIGRGTVGYGTSDRYTGNIMLSGFQNDRRISIIGSTSNINNREFDLSEMSGKKSNGMRSMGGSMGGFGGGHGGSEGIITSTVAGINYVDNISNKLQLNGSYIYGSTKNHTEGSSLQQTLVPADSTTLQGRESFSDSRNTNHVINIQLNYKIDSMNSLFYKSSMSLQRSGSFSSDTNYTRVTNKGLNYLALSGTNRNMNSTEGIDLNNQLMYRRRFRKLGRTFTLGWSNSINNSDGDGTTNAPLIFYNPSGNIDSTRDQDFITFQKTRSNNNEIRSTYTEPVGKNKLLETNYAYTNNINTSDQKGVSYNPVTKQYDSLNAQQTNYFENTFLAHRLGINFRYQGKVYNFQLGAGMQNSKLNNSSMQGIYRINGKDSTIVTKQTYTIFFPTASFGYNFSKGKGVGINYQGRTNQPTIKQLQDVRDETNVLQTVVGNPNLKQEFNHIITIGYQEFSAEKFRSIMANVNYSQTSNKIVNSIDLDTVRGRGIQLIKPINLNGVYNISSNIIAGIYLRNNPDLKGSNINFTNSIQYGRSISSLYGQNNATKNLTISQSAGVNLTIREKWDIGFRGSFSYNRIKYSLQQSQNLNTNYFSQTYSADLNYFIRDNLLLFTDFNYNINSGLSAGYNQNVPIWNGGIAYQAFKKKNGEIKLSANDILNQNRSINRQIGENYILDTKTMVLKRYFLITFTYNFNSFGGSKDPKSEFRMNRKGHF